MSKRNDDAFLQDILEAASRIATYTAEMTYEGFLKDIRTQDAVVRNLEIVGEATKNLSTGLRTQHPHIPWENMAGVRDKLIHHYFGVNLDIVWHIVTTDLPAAASQIKKIIIKRESE